MSEIPRNVYSTIVFPFYQRTNYGRGKPLVLYGKKRKDYSMGNQIINFSVTISKLPTGRITLLPSETSFFSFFSIRSQR